MKLRYEDLLIKDVTMKDADLLLSWWNDGSVMAHAGFPEGLHTTKEKILEDMEKYDENRQVMILLDGEEPIGECNVRFLEDHAEIGIKICVFEKQEKGLGKKYLSMLLEKVFERTDLVTLDTDAENKRARHVYEELGFKLKEIKEAFYKNDQMDKAMDVAFYECPKEDFHTFLDTYYLVRPDLYFADQIISYRQEYIDIGLRAAGAEGLMRHEDPKKWIGHIRMMEDQRNLLLPMKASFQYVYVDHRDDEIVGTICLRPDMSDSPFLAEYGGHIGYSVRPSRWRQGIGKKMLHDFLPVARDVYGMEKVLITCNESNAGSRGVILANGGVLERKTWLEADKEYIERYWITLK